MLLGAVVQLPNQSQCNSHSSFLFPSSRSTQKLTPLSAGSNCLQHFLMKLGV
jgi:hypothetical protein